MQHPLGLESAGPSDDEVPSGAVRPTDQVSRRRRSVGRGSRHSLMLLATDEIDLITSAGGLLVDRVMTGWRVTAHVDTCRVERAVRILGATPGDLASATTWGGDDTWPDAIVASATLVESNPVLRRLLRTAARQAGTEVAFWGGSWPIDQQKGVGPVEHQLSLAARAFKSHALAAAEVPDLAASPTETFTSGRTQFTIAAPLTPTP